MVREVTLGLATLGVIGQVLAGLLLLGALTWLAVARGPLETVRATLDGL